MFIPRVYNCYENCSNYIPWVLKCYDFHSRYIPMGILSRGGICVPVTTGRPNCIILQNVPDGGINKLKGHN